MKQYKTVPNTPDILNEDGEQFFKLYCQYFLDRNYLTSDLVPDIEHLAHMQQQRVKMQREMRDDETRWDYLLSEMKSLSREIRQYKKHMMIYPRANEFEKPESDQEKKEKKIEGEAKITKLASKNY